MTNELGWYDTVDLATALRILGVKQIPVYANTYGAAMSRARGYWDANEREYYVAYRSIAAHFSRLGMA